MKSRFAANRFDASLIGVQWALRFILLIMAAAALAACSDDPTGNNGGIANVQITVAATQVEQGDSVLLAAAPRRADGTINTSAVVTWLSTDTSIAVVEARAGQKASLRAKHPGPVRIYATAGDKTAEITLTVIVTQVTGPELDSISPSFASKGSAVVNITVTGKNFTELSVVKWNNVAIATQFVSNKELRGLVSGAQLTQVGTALVTVSNGPPNAGTTAAKVFSIIPAVANVRVEVTQPTLWVGEQTQLSAIPVAEDGEDLPKRATQWQSTEPDILSVDANGVVTPVRPGLATVLAIVEGKVGSTYVHAVEPPQYDLMYESTRAGIRELWVVSLGANSTPRRWLPAGFSGEDAATDRNGNRIVFVSRDQFQHSDIWVANRDGSGLTRLTSTEGTDDQPAWSPDGTQIAFRSTRAGYSDIWVMNADGSNQRNVTGAQYRFGDPVSQRPSWAVNGHIYFQFGDQSITPQRWQLASIQVDGSAAVTHTPAGDSDFDPAVSWSGSTIALRRVRGDTDYGVILTNLTGAPLFMINTPGVGEMPAWSRNDQYLAYVGKTSANAPANQIFVTQVNGFWRKQITIGAAAGGGRNPVFVQREEN